MTEADRLQSELELAQLEKQKGGILTPEDVVEFAKANPKSATHKRFDWDLKSAAYSHWLEQARNILRVWVRVVDDGDTQKEMRATVSVSAPTPDNPQAREYQSTEIVLSNEETRRQLIYNTLRRIAGILRSYPIDELSPLSKQVDRLMVNYAPPEAPTPPGPRPPAEGPRAGASQ